MVVIGGDAAGMTAASQAVRTARPGEIDVIAFERGPRTSYAACGLPYFVEGLVDSPTRLIARTPEQFAEAGITVHVLHEVTALDTAERTVEVLDLSSGEVRIEGWDELVIATGAEGIVPPLPGIDADGVMQLRTLDDAIEIDRRIRDGARRAVVVGAGYIGLEVVEALAARGLEVSVLELAETPMAGALDADMAELVSDAVRQAGVALRLGEAVVGFERDGGHLSAVLSPASPIAADVAVLGLGVRPNVRLAAASGIPIGDAGGIVVDSSMHTPLDGVWAAGDCVESLHRVTGRQVVIALGTHANRQGRVLGTNLGGGTARFPGVIGTAITKFDDLEIARTGLTESQATAEGIRVSSTVTGSRTKVPYLPGSEAVTVKLVFRDADGVLVGAQVIGGEGAGKRIDTLATAIWAAMTVGELAMVDLSYSPPFSPVFDPVSLAAGKAAAHRAGP